MIITTGNILLVGSILLIVSIVLSKAGYRFGVPTLLVFLIAGMLFGSDGLGLQFHNRCYSLECHTIFGWS